MQKLLVARLSNGNILVSVKDSEVDELKEFAREEGYKMEVWLRGQPDSRRTIYALT
jgi:hypothetical protein